MSAISGTLLRCACSIALSISSSHLFALINSISSSTTLFHSTISEFLLTANTRLIGKIAIEREEDVLYLRIHHLMQTLNRAGTRRNMVEGGLHLRHVLELDGDVKVPQLRRSEAKL